MRWLDQVCRCYKKNQRVNLITSLTDNNCNRFVQREDFLETRL